MTLLTIATQIYSALLSLGIFFLLGIPLLVAFYWVIEMAKIILLLLSSLISLPIMSATILSPSVQPSESIKKISLIFLNVLFRAPIIIIGFIMAILLSEFLLGTVLSIFITGFDMLESTTGNLLKSGPYEFDIGTNALGINEAINGIHKSLDSIFNLLFSTISFFVFFSWLYVFMMYVTMKIFSMPAQLVGFVEGILSGRFENSEKIRTGEAMGLMGKAG